MTLGFEEFHRPVFGREVPRDRLGGTLFSAVGARGDGVLQLGLLKSQIFSGVLGDGSSKFAGGSFHAGKSGGLASDLGRL